MSEPIAVQENMRAVANAQERRMAIRTGLLVLLPLAYYVLVILDRIPYQAEVAEAVATDLLPLYRTLVTGSLLFVYLISYVCRIAFTAISSLCLAGVAAICAFDLFVVVPRVDGEVRSAFLGLLLLRLFSMYLLAGNLRDHLRATSP